MAYKTSASLEQKSINRNEIYRLLWRGERLSKQDIVQKLGLSLPTVTNNLNDLCGENLVVENGSFGNTGGRSARGYSVNARARMAVGVDINLTHIAVVVVDLYGHVLESLHEHHHYEKTAAYYRRVGQLAVQTMQKAGVRDEALLGVGISIQGLLSEDRSQVIFGPILDNAGETADTIAQYIPYSCELFHDADMAAFAELWVSPEIDNAVYVSLSTNLGGSVIVDRGIFKGTGTLAGKLEHMTLHPGGKPCYCGQKGCAEAYCGVVHLLEGIGDGKLDTFFAKLRAGEPEVQKRWTRYVEDLAILLNNLYMLMDTQIILGGYMAPYLEPYLPEIRQAADSRNSVISGREFIRIGRFQQEAVAAGSALHYVEQFLKTV